MFIETHNVHQIKGEPVRRWFTDNDLELIVWLDKQKRIIGFQLCYEINRKLKALTWHENGGYLHSGIDDGENKPGHHKATPVLIPDGEFDKENIIKRFALSVASLPVEMTKFVTNKIKEFETGINSSRLQL